MLNISLNCIHGVFMSIPSFLFVLTGAASMLFGLAYGLDFLKMVITVFVIFLLSHIGKWLIERIALL